MPSAGSRACRASPSISLITDPGLRIAREASRHRHDDAAQAQQGVEQRLVHDLPERALRRAVSRDLPRAQAGHALLSVLRRRDDVRRQARGGTAGFKFWKPLVWDKATIGMGYHYRARYEFILFFEKGKRRLNDLGIADIISVPRIRGGYPAEKPAEVADVLIRQSTEPGDVVVDPFMGSGSVGHRGGAARAALSRQRSESRSRADCRASAARVRRRARAAGYQ